MSAAASKVGLTLSLFPSQQQLRFSHRYLRCAHSISFLADQVTGQAAAEGKKAGADLGATVDKTKADVRAGAKKAKAEMEKP